MDGEVRRGLRACHVGPFKDGENRRIPRKCYGLGRQEVLYCRVLDELVKEHLTGELRSGARQSVLCHGPDKGLSEEHYEDVF